MTRVILFLVHNWPLKLAAIVLATLLYGVIVLTQDSRQIPGAVPIVAQSQPADVVLVSPLGDARNIRYFTSDDGVQATSASLRAFVDFRGVTVKAGTVILPVTVDSIDPRIDVLAWEPRQVSVTIDELVSRSVPVEVVRGEIPAGLEVREAELEFSTVRVRGASSEVARVNRAEARVEIEPGALDIDREVTLSPVDATGATVPQIDVEPPTVHVRIAVFTDRKTRSIPIDPVVTGEPAPGFELAGIDVEPLIVLLEGDDEELRAMSRAQTEPIPLTGATDSFERTVGLALPTGVLAVESDDVRVRITLRPVTATRTFNAGIDPDGERSGLSYALSVESVLVTIGGSVADLDRLEGRSFTVEAAVGGLEPGEHSVPITANLPAGLTLVSASPPRITVTITAPPEPSGSPDAAPSP